MYEPTKHPRNKVYTYWIDIVGTCNLRCPTCPTGNVFDSELSVGRNPTGFMDFNLYKDILKKIKADDVSDRIEIHLYTWGEPLLHPKVAEFITITKKMGFYCGISSNLNLDKNLQNVVKASPDFFRVSLSGFYQNQYKLTHKRGDIRIVKSNMYKLRFLLDQYQISTAVQVLYHVYNHNAADDLSMMIKLCEELNFSLDPVWAFFMPLEKSLDYLNGIVSDEDKKTIKMLAMDPHDVAKAASSHLDSDCILRKNQTSLNIDGSVQLCCATFDRGHVVAPSFIETPQTELQRLRYSNKMCTPCMEKGQHVYFSYNVGKKLDQLGEERLNKSKAKFIFKQFSEPHLTIRAGTGKDEVVLPRAPRKKKLRGLRRYFKMPLKR
jgi:organic radical activating enzyme